MNIKRIIFLSQLILLPVSMHGENIIFDIYGVLFHIPTKTKLRLLGLKPVSYLFIEQKNPAKLRNLFLETLSKVPVPEQLKSRLPQNINAKADDQHMAPIMLLWQANEISYKEALDLTVSYIKSQDKETFSDREKELLIGASMAAFDLETRKKIFAPIEKGIKILKRCAAEVDGSGQKKHKLFILSNMDPEMMDHLKSEYPDIFLLFDGIIYSGEKGFLKPDLRIYEEALTRYNLDPRDCIFIDDQIENVEAARLIGITGVLCKNFKTVEQTLESIGILPQKKHKPLFESVLDNKSILFSVILVAFIFYQINRS